MSGLLVPDHLGMREATEAEILSQPCVVRALAQQERNVGAAHWILTAAGVMPAAGQPCNDRNCISHVTHRIHVLVAERDEAVAELRSVRGALGIDAAPRMAVGDVVTSATVSSLPIGSVVKFRCGGKWERVKKNVANRWEGDGHVLTDAALTDPSLPEPVFVHRLPFTIAKDGAAK